MTTKQKYVTKASRNPTSFFPKKYREQSFLFNFFEIRDNQSTFFNFYINSVLTNRTSFPFMLYRSRYFVSAHNMPRKPARNAIRTESNRILKSFFNIVTPCLQTRYFLTNMSFFKYFQHGA